MPPKDYNNNDKQPVPNELEKLRKKLFEAELKQSPRFMLVNARFSITVCYN